MFKLLALLPTLVSVVLPLVFKGSVDCFLWLRQLCVLYGNRHYCYADIASCSSYNYELSVIKCVTDMFRLLALLPTLLSVELSWAVQVLLPLPPAAVSRVATGVTDTCQLLALIPTVVCCVSTDVTDTFRLLAHLPAFVTFVLSLALLGRVDCLLFFRGSACVVTVITRTCGLLPFLPADVSLVCY